MNNNAKVLVLAFVVYLVSAGLSYAVFSNAGGGADDDLKDVKVTATKDENDALVFSGDAAKTEECPLNGAKYSKEQRKWWESHRPLGVMIENHTEARPQSGFNAADVVYEAVAEGGITRFLSVFYCQDAGIVGPVRSARTYFLDFISEYGDYPLYAHVGGANTPGPANALGQIEDYGWAAYNDINQFSVGFPTFRRDESRLGRPVATEHTMYSTTSRLWKVAQERKLTEKNEDGDKWDAEFEPYTFKEDAKIADRPAAQTINAEFWEGYKQFAVDWVYNKEQNSYLRKNGGAVHKDRNTDKQITAKTVVALFMRESNANDGYENNLHLLYGTKGSGKATVFMDGKEIPARWTKSGRTGRTTITTTSGDEIEFNRGKIWFMVLPLEGIVTAQ